MPFSKFDPNRPVERSPEASTPAGARRILVLRWVNPLVFAYTALGFGFIVYWMARKWTPHPLAFASLTGGTAIAGYLLGRVWMKRAEGRAWFWAWVAALFSTVAGFVLMGLWLLRGW
ncbi:MAG: hypothetical protein V4510_03060 [bacterium]